MSQNLETRSVLETVNKQEAGTWAEDVLTRINIFKLEN